MRLWFLIHLRENEVEQIVEIELSKLNRRLSNVWVIKYPSTIKLKSFCLRLVLMKNMVQDLLKRAIQEKIEDLISEEVLRGNIVEGKPCKLKMKGKEEVVLEKGK